MLHLCRFNGSLIMLGRIAPAALYQNKTEWCHVGNWHFKMCYVSYWMFDSKQSKFTSHSVSAGS